MRAISPLWTLLATIALAGCQGLVTYERQDSHTQPANENEMVYAAVEGGISAFRVTPTDGSLQEIDFMPGKFSGLQVSLDGKFLFASSSTLSKDEDYYQRKVLMVPLKINGRFAGPGMEVFSLENLGELTITQDGRFFVTHTTDAPACDQWNYRCNYLDWVRTYKIDYSDGLPRATFASEFSIERDYQTVYDGRWFYLRRTFQSAYGQQVALQWYCYEFELDCRAWVEALNIDSEGRISKSQMFIPSSSTKEFFVRGYEAFGVEASWNWNWLRTSQSLPGHQPQYIWTCRPDYGTPEHYQYTPPPKECRIGEAFAFAAAGDRLFVAGAEGDNFYLSSPTPAKLWSRPFSFQSGIAPEGSSIDTPYRPSSLILSSRGTTLIGTETSWHDESQYHSTVKASQLFVYKINADGSLSEIPNQPPLPVVYSIAVH